MNTLKSIGAVVAGFLTVVILSVATDAVLESTGLFPPQSEPAAYTAQLLLIALVYRCIYTIAGGYVTARLAPRQPMRYALILGIVGIIAGLGGVIFSWNLTPHHWYPIALVVTALPCTWLGGKLFSRKREPAIALQVPNQ
ncbi:MAG: hypothetical protein HY961_15895 [Ignavibacteriae bacterium]|nr:hypothetical protein [Ignavibacteriota bacterium]